MVARWQSVPGPMLTTAPSARIDDGTRDWKPDGL